MPHTSSQQNSLPPLLSLPSAREGTLSESEEDSPSVRENAPSDLYFASLPGTDSTPVLPHAPTAAENPYACPARSLPSFEEDDSNAPSRDLDRDHATCVAMATGCGVFGAISAHSTWWGEVATTYSFGASTSLSISPAVATAIGFLTCTLGTYVVLRCWTSVLGRWGRS